MLLGTVVMCAAVLGQPLAEPGKGVRYDGHKVVSVVVDDDRMLRAVLNLSEGFWGCGAGGTPGAEPIQVHVTPDGLAALDDLGLAYVVDIDNIQAGIDAENARLADAAREKSFVRGELPGTFFDDYRTNQQISDYMNALVAEHPQRVTRQAIGQSILGREIYAMRMTAPGKGPRPVILMNALQHAREWLAGSTGAFIVDQLVRNPDADPRIEALLNDFEVILIPVVNPDGYAHSWEVNRLWRKNRRPMSEESPCLGVDTNRNWAAFWESSSCSDTYSGSAPFSEPETQAVRDFAATLPGIIAYVDLHTYGRLFVSPYGHQAAPPAHAAALFDEFNNGLLRAVKDAGGGPFWLGGPGFRHLGYAVHGGAKDWFFEDRGAVAWTWELRDNSFTTPPHHILPGGRETFACVLQLGDTARAHALMVRYAGDGRPTRVSSSTTTPVRFVVMRGVSEPDANASRLWYRIGRVGAFVQAALSEDKDGSLTGDLPSVPCGAVVQYFVEAHTQAGGAFTDPPGGAAQAYEAAASDADVILEFDMETAQGWTADSWRNVEPNGSATQPEHSAQGMQCWMTGTANEPGVPINIGDVDGAVPAYLTSPPLDLTGYSSVTVSYWRWFSANLGRETDIDTFVVEASPDGTTWFPVETVGPGGLEARRGWFSHSFRLDALFAPTAQARIRFSTSDIGADTYVEAAVDDVVLYEERCPGACPGDWTRDGIVNSVDVGEFINSWFEDQANGTLSTDFDHNGISNSVDVGEFINAWFVPCV